MRVLERDESPAASYALRPGIAWYAGRQNRDNSINDPPPSPYLCLPPEEAVQRSWYAARIGTIYAEGREITVLYFVDPATKHLYAQPHPNTREWKERDWGIAEPREQWEFDRARETARWIFKSSRGKTGKHADWWRGYMTAPDADAPPVPFGVPVDPDNAYRAHGWISFKDWLVKPGRKRDSARNA